MVGYLMRLAFARPRVAPPGRCSSLPDGSRVVYQSALVQLPWSSTCGPSLEALEADQACDPPAPTPPCKTCSTLLFFGCVSRCVGCSMLALALQRSPLRQCTSTPKSGARASAFACAHACPEFSPRWLPPILSTVSATASDLDFAYEFEQMCAQLRRRQSTVSDRSTYTGSAATSTSKSHGQRGGKLPHREPIGSTTTETCAAV